MSRSQDTLAVLKGLQLIAKASLRTNEEYLKHLWSNSTVRDVISNNCESARHFTNKLTQNPGKELEHAAYLLKETVERTSVVVEGVRQYAVSSSGIADKLRTNSSGSKESDESIGSAIINAANLDISAITLKELEQYLSQKVEIKKGKARTDVPLEQKEPEVSTTEATAADPKLFLRNEKYVQDWMKFISEHDPDKSGKHERDEVVEAKTPQESVKPTPTIISDAKSTEAPDLIKLPELSAVAKQRKVPSSRIGRMASFGSLFAGLGVGTVNALAKGALGLGGATDVKSALFSPANAERIVDTLCRVRGAALKLGQILSIQDSSIVSPQLVKAFDRVRQAADYMPDWQVEKVLKGEFGSDWQTKLKSFDVKPFAAASIGQVHRAVLLDGTEVAVKIQYPGVARSIESDIDNLVGMLKVWDVFPAGIFIDNVVKVAKRELVWEVDYLREANYTEKYGEMVQKYKEYRVPKVIRELTTKSILTTELVPGVPLDKCFELSYEHRLIIGSSVLKLCLRELFELRCMQTDPNWSNFLYDTDSKTLMLIDFGSSRFYTNDFIENYRDIIIAAVDDDYNKVLHLSREMKFLTGYETKQMEQAHVNAVMILGEMFRYSGEFDFGKQNTTKQIASLVPTMIAHRLCPPPEEIYSIHRKLSGVFLLCSRLNVKMDCRPIFDEIIRR